VHPSMLCYLQRSPLPLATSRKLTEFLSKVRSKQYTCCPMRSFQAERIAKGPAPLGA